MPPSINSQCSHHRPTVPTPSPVNSQCPCHHSSSLLPNSHILSPILSPLTKQQSTAPPFLDTISTFDITSRITPTTTPPPPPPPIRRTPSPMPSYLLPTLMAPKTPILGLHLTHPTASSHLKTALALLSLLTHQLRLIPHLDPQQLDFTSHLQAIQIRHSDIVSQLSTLIKELDGCADWVKELGDGLAGMRGKVKACNHMSKPASVAVYRSGYGRQSGSGPVPRAGRKEMQRAWQSAATTYWPFIAESYALLIPVLERVRDDVSDGLDRLEGRRASSEIIFADRVFGEEEVRVQSMAQLEMQMKARRRQSVVSWFGGRPSQKSSKPSQLSKKPPTKSVTFAKAVQARWFSEEDTVVNSKAVDGMKRDHVLPLMSDRKRSAGNYKGRKTKVKAGQYGTGSGSGGGWIPSTATW